MVDARRVRSLNEQPVGTGPVLYWMQRGQRAVDNWALLYAAERAEARETTLIVVFNMVPSFQPAPFRAYDFLIKGLQEVEATLRSLKVPFYVTTGEPAESIPRFVREQGVGEVVADFNPMRVPRSWHETVAAAVDVKMWQVDEHNIVPCWVASPKEEFAAYTFRPKIHRLLKEFLTPYPPLPKTVATAAAPQIDWKQVCAGLTFDMSVPAVTWLTPGTKAATALLDDFVSHKLAHYDTGRNDPTLDAQSNLSPYLHFGQLSAQTVALAVQSATTVPGDAKNAYLEELIVRRELTDNYCYYNHQHDTVAGAHAWAQKTIAEHAKDTREHLYSKETFERGSTHDELWNAMQRQMVQTGKMHGWCRMYWAKKILEWTPDVQTAIDIALYLNDKYELDGRDPNGVVGVMWSICGVHDRAWNERPVFGKIRYMNYNGAKRKFDIAAYMARYGSEQTLFSE